MRQLSVWKCGSVTVAFWLLSTTAYPTQHMNREVCDATFIEMKRAAPIEGYLNYAQVYAIQTHCRELETQQQYVNAIQRCQHQLIRFYHWVCGGFF